MADQKPQPLPNELPGLKDKYPTATTVDQGIAYDASHKALGPFETPDATDPWASAQVENAVPAPAPASSTGDPAVSASSTGDPAVLYWQNATHENANPAETQGPWANAKVEDVPAPERIGPQPNLRPSIFNPQPPTRQQIYAGTEGIEPPSKIDELMNLTEAYKKEHPVIGFIGDGLRHLKETFEPAMNAAAVLSLGEGLGETTANRPFTSGMDRYNHAVVMRDGARVAYEGRLQEYDAQLKTAQQHAEAAQQARAMYENGQITPEQRYAVETRASEAQSQANKAAKALNEAWKSHSDASEIVDNLRDGVTRRANLKARTRAAEANKRFKAAVPPGRSNAANFNNEDLNTIRGYMEDHHQKVAPINTIQDVYDTLGRVKNDIEGQIQPYIQKYAREPITTNPLQDVHEELSKNPEVNFAQDGMKELENWNLIDPSVEEAQKILTNLNAQNRAILDNNPQVQIGTHLATDPAFAARYHAAESLRDGIYETLEDHGVTNARQVRQVERAAIKVENATRNALPHGEAKVRPGGPKDRLGQAAAKNSLTRNDMMGKSFDIQGAGTPRIDVGGPGTPSVPQAFDAPSSDYNPNELSWQDMHRVNQEFGDLHSELSTYFRVPIDQTNFGSLESKFMLNMEQKMNKGIELEPKEADLYGKINQARGQALQQFSKAAVSLGPTPDPTLPRNPKPHAIIHGDWQDGLNSVNGMVHELAHSTVAKELLGDKLPIAEIVSDSHPASQAVGGMASVILDWPNSAYVDEAGNLDVNKVIDDFDDIAAVYMAGGVANDLYHDVPVHLNKHLGSDVKAFNHLMDTIGAPSELRPAIRQSAITKAAEVLGRPGTEDVLHSHAEVREPNISKNRHFSPERLDQVHEDLKTRWDYEDRKGKLTGNVRASSGQSKQGPGGRAGEAANRQPKAGAKGGDGENGGTQPEGRKGTRESVPVSANATPTATVSKNIEGLEPEQFGYMRPDGTTEQAARTDRMSTHHDLAFSKGEDINKIADAPGGVRYGIGKSPAMRGNTSAPQRGFITISNTEPETILNAIKVVGKLPVQEIDFEFENLKGRNIDFQGSPKEVLRKIRQEFLERTVYELGE